MIDKLNIRGLLINVFKIGITIVNFVYNLTKWEPEIKEGEELAFLFSRFGGNIKIA